MATKFIQIVLKHQNMELYHGRFVLASEVNSGTYGLVISTKNKEITKNFKVNPYIVPKFEAKLTTDKDNYIMGEEINFKINANYFFGEPVANAEIKGKIIQADYSSSRMNATKETEFVGLTNSNGEFEFAHKTEMFGKIDIQAEIVDTSNYLVEANKTIAVGTDIFEIDILPENGDIIKGVDNDIYIITKTADGKPVKTAGRVTIGTVTRQVITDDFGVGKISLTSSDLSKIPETQNYNYNNYGYYDDYTNSSRSGISNMTVILKDADENEVTLKTIVNISSNKGTVINTDKVKYNLGEDIHINLQSAVDATENIIYIFKNKELIQMITTDNDEIDINLEDTYGLVDIYVGVNSPRIRNNYYMYDNIRQNNYFSYNKRTIFIKPDKSLNIEIQTEKEEYKPGDTLNINFTTKDSSNNNIDSALLVSILDEAILSLAGNDLSIDNIKLALEDIILTEGITAADVYANIIDDASDTLLIGLLLKQSNTDPNVIQGKYDNREGKEENFKKMILSGFLAIGLIIIYASIKSKRFGSIFEALTIMIGIFVVLVMFLQDFIYYDINMDVIPALLTIALLTIIAYSTILYKFKKVIFEMARDMILIPGVIVLILMALITVFRLQYRVNEAMLLILLLIAPAILSIIKMRYRDKKISNKIQRVENIVKKITTIEIIYFISLFISSAIFRLSVNYFEDMKFIVGIFIIIYLIYYKFIARKDITNGDVQQKTKNSDGSANVQLNVTIGETAGVIGIIIIILLVGMYVYNSSAGTIQDAGSAISSYERNNVGIDINAFDSVTDSAVFKGTSSGLNNITNNINSLFETDRASVSESEIVLEKNVQEVISETEENVRNVFLESLVFIPELITNNGNAETSLRISDNITTWNIQTVGNTKSGEIGFAGSSIKVFKEFFVDFELPKNAVVTDKISIPVTVYNYTEDDLVLNLNMIESDWYTTENYSRELKIESKGTRMIYVPIEVLKNGDNTLRIEVGSGNLSDIVEKTMEVKPNGLEKASVVSTGTMESKLSQDILIDDNLMIDNTANLKVKLFASPITQAIEGIENIFRMPTGCFEQTSSSLYPNVLALRYLNENKLDNNDIKEKALSYISSGYQRLLTFEVKGEKGGYSLYGHSPAVPVLTAYGLMQLKDLSEVYDIDENVLENMKEYLFKQQNINGSFSLGNDSHIGGAGSSDTLSLNAYITWALSESYPDDNRLSKSVKYLEDNINKMTDTYTLALAANVFANTNNKSADAVVKKIMEKVQTNGEMAYLTSSIRDYYGSYGTTQNIQTTALTSMALTKLKSNAKTNTALVNYIVYSKDRYGTWHSTQATILALKAVIEYSSGSDISEQDITVNVNGEERKISIDKNAIDLYELNFANIGKENNITINMKKGRLYYEIIQSYYADYSDQLLKSQVLIDVKQDMKQIVRVNEVVEQKISVVNNSGDMITNGMIEINIPQGFSVVEESLIQLEYDMMIEKYEYNYGKVYLYLKDFANTKTIEAVVKYRANYPVNITGGSIRVYDYYNPEIEGICLPIQITVSE